MWQLGNNQKMFLIIWSTLIEKIGSGTVLIHEYRAVDRKTRKFPDQAISGQYDLLGNLQFTTRQIHKT